MDFKIGDRAKFTGKDRDFHYGEREGKVGTIVYNSTLDVSNDFNGCCFWQIDGDERIYLTSLSDLTKI